MFCGLKKTKVIMRGTRVCSGDHNTEIADPNVRYTYTFDTVRPEMFTDMGEEKNG
jgi:hypothetical protein